MDRLNKQSDIEALLWLKSVGKLSGFPLSNYIALQPLAADKLFETLGNLKNRGLIKLKGPKSLEDLKPFIEKGAPYKDVIKTGDHSYQNDNGRVLTLMGDQSGDFFKTQIRLTLAGHLAASTLKLISRDPAKSAHAEPSKPSP